jgi:hypothetical protein
MSVQIQLSDDEAQRIADLAHAALSGDGHRPSPCPICDLASAVLDALARGDVAPRERPFELRVNASLREARWYRETAWIYGWLGMSE